MAFARHVIVISRDDRFPTEVCTDDGLNDGAHLFRHCPSACVCEASCPGGIAEVLGSLVAGRIQCPQASTDVFTLSQVVIANRGADPSGSTVDHQPQATVRIALQLDEMVPATERRKLDQPFVTPYRLQAWMTQRRVRHFRWSRDRLAPISAPRGHGAAESSEDSASCPRIFQRGRFNVNANRQHAAADVAAYGLRIN
jgi:hypothetical protein